MSTAAAIAAKASQLAEKIASTNNGYLFAPTAEEVYIATLFPDDFLINYAPLAEHFPFRIAVRDNN